MSRDNFSKKDIEILRTRVANRCSNPECRVVTTGPNYNQDKATILGDAAHICAASKGGPRYDPQMTSKERKSINNAIWLCKNCARKIDVDSKSYSVELLHEWKKMAEQKANEELNNQLFNQHEVNNEIINSITSLHTGIFPSSVNAMHNLIHNVISANTKKLEEMDPRFKITSNFTENITHYRVTSKEDVNLELNIKDNSTSVFKEKFTDFIEHGKDFYLNSDQISFSGSKLINFFANNSSIIQFCKFKKDAIIRLWLIENDTQIIDPLNEIPGNLSFGLKSFSFNGSCFNGLMNINFKFFYQQTESLSIKISTKVSLEKWNGQDILKLSYFSKLWNLFKKIEQGWLFCFDLEIDGEKILANAQLKMEKDDSFYKIYTFLQYTNLSILICKKLNKHIKFTTQVSFSSEEHQKIAETQEILYNGITSKIFPEKPAKSTIIVSKENISLLKQKFEPTSIIYQQNEGDLLSLFNQSIQLPPKLITLNSVLPTVLIENIDDIVEGNEVELVMNPVDGYELLMEYKSNI